MRRHAWAAVGLTGILIGTVCAEPPDVVRVPRAWASRGTDYSNTDSLAACRLPDGVVHLFATAKDGHRIDIFDAATGAFVKHHGRQGTAPGEFDYPNGIVAVDFGAGGPAGPANRAPRAILVVERDNHRVQAFWCDSLAPAGMFGATELRRPYGAAVSYRPDGIYLYVTDTTVPPDRTVHQFKLARVEGQIQAQPVRVFGAATGPGVIQTAESIAVDDRLGRVLLCDEARRDVKVYTLDGEFTGRVFAREQIRREPEGIIVVDTRDGGYVMVTDQQKELSTWHIYDRTSYRHLAAFTGTPRIANTDGICSYPDPLPGLPGGAFFAVNDDADVHAFPLAEILGLAGAAPAAGAPETAPNP